MNKKICHITTVHPPFDTRIFHKECKTLVKAGYDVTLIVQHNKNEIVDGIKIVALPKPKNRFQRMFFLTRKAYKLALEQKADIYHFHDPELIPWMVKLKKKTGAKIIYDVHEDYPQQIISKYWLPKIIRGLLSFSFNFYEKYAVKKLDYIIAATPHIAKTFNQKNITDIKNYPLIDKKVLINFNSKDHERKVCILIYIGGLEKIRGIKEIIKSLNYINNNVKLKLAGNFSDRTFEIDIKTMPEWKRVNFLNQIKFEKINQELNNADIGLALYWPEPNHIEAFPNKIFEYMAAGLPIIASDFPLWKEIIEKNNCGICINPLNPKEIAKTIEYLIKHPKEAEKMGENSRKTVLKKYNWENESKKLLKIYEKVLK